PPRRRRASTFERRPDDGLKGAEVSVVQQAPALEPRHDVEDLAVLLARRTDDELGRRADGGEPRRSLLPPALEHEAPGQLEIRQQVAGEVLLAREGADVGGAGRFEIDGDA